TSAILAAEEAHNPLIPAWYDIIWSIVVFVPLLLVVAFVLVPRLNRVLDARRDAIEGGIKRAEKAKAEAAAALEQYTAKLADARGEAAGIRDAARADGAKIISEAKETAQAEAARITANAHAQIEAERQSTFVALRSEVGTLALDLAGGVVGETLTEDKRAQAVVDRFLADLEAS